MNKMKRNMQQGFTLIELMIVIAIVAILVALAVPAYKDYTIRAKVTECVNGAAVPKLSISEYRQTVGEYPATETLAGTIAPAGQSHYCQAFTYSAGAGDFYVETQELVIDSGIAGSIEPQLFPTDNGQGGVDWRCAYGNTSPANIKYLPSTCRGT